MNLSASPRCNLPPELTKACGTFQNFYLGRHSGRRLTWQSNMVKKINRDIVEYYVVRFCFANFIVNYLGHS